MRVKPSADAQRPMAGDAVSFRVAAHASVQAAFRFERMVPRPRGSIAPDRLRRMESSAVTGTGRARFGDPDPQMAVQAKTLLPMATLASLRAHPGLDGVHVQIIVRMDRSRANAPVVAIRAEFVLVAASAEGRILACDLLVALEKIGRMGRITQPRRREQRPRCKCGLNPASRRGRVARVARVLGVAARGGVGHIVAAKAALHPGKAVARREVEPLDGAVALSAANVADGVGAMAEDEVSSRIIDLPDSGAIVGRVSGVALGAALSVDRRRGDMLMIDFVTGVAHAPRRQQAILGRRAGGRACVTCDTGRSDGWRKMTRVAKQQGDALTGEYDRAGARVGIVSARGEPSSAGGASLSQRPRVAACAGDSCGRCERDRSDEQDPEGRSQPPNRHGHSTHIKGSTRVSAKTSV